MLFKLFDKKNQKMIYKPEDFTKDEYPELYPVTDIILNIRGYPLVVLNSRKVFPLDESRYVVLLNTFVKNNKGEFLYVGDVVKTKAGEFIVQLDEEFGFYFASEKTCKAYPIFVYWGSNCFEINGNIYKW